VTAGVRAGPFSLPGRAAGVPPAKRVPVPGWRNHAYATRAPAARGASNEEVVQLLALPGDGIGGAGALATLVDLGVDQPGLGQQRGDVVSHELVEVVGADGLVGADPAGVVVVVVAAQAPRDLAAPRQPPAVKRGYTGQDDHGMWARSSLG